MIYLDFDERLLIEQKEAILFRLNLGIQHLLNLRFSSMDQWTEWWLHVLVFYLNLKI